MEERLLQSVLRMRGHGFGTDGWLEVTNGPDVACAGRLTVRL